MDFANPRSVRSTRDGTHREVLCSANREGPLRMIIHGRQTMALSFLGIIKPDGLTRRDPLEALLRNHPRKRTQSRSTVRTRCLLWNELPFLLDQRPRDQNKSRWRGISGQETHGFRASKRNAHPQRSSTTTRRQSSEVYGMRWKRGRSRYTKREGLMRQLPMLRQLRRLGSRCPKRNRHETKHL